MSRYDNFPQDYEKYRVEYPNEFIDFLKYEFKINKTKICCDLGCGTGKFAKRILPFLKQLEGIDISQGMLEIASRVGTKFKPIY